MAATKIKPVEEKQDEATLQPNEVKPVTEHQYQEPELQRDEALVQQIDAEGQPVGKPFKTSVATADKYYNDPTQFTIKKK